MEPSLNQNPNLNIYQPFIKIGQSDSSDRPTLRVNELGSIVFHTDRSNRPTELSVRSIEGEEKLNLINEQAINKVFELLNHDFNKQKISQEVYLQVFKGIRTLADTQHDPQILEATKRNFELLKKSFLLYPDLVEKAKDILHESSKQADSIDALRAKYAELRKKGVSQEPRSLFSSISQALKRRDVKDFVVKASDATMDFLPPGVVKQEEIDAILSVFIKSNEAALRYLKALDLVKEARIKNFEMIKKGTPPTLQDNHNLIASYFIYDLIANVSQELEDPVKAKPVNLFLQGMMEQATPMNYQTIEDVFMMGIRGVPRPGTEERRDVAIRHFNQTVNEYSKPEQELIRAKFIKRGVGFDVWERAEWKPLIEIPLADGNRILLKGLIEVDFARPDKALTSFKIEIDLTSLGDIQELQKMSFEEFQAIFTFLKEFIGSSAEKAYPQYKGDKIFFRRENKEGKFIEEKKESLKFLSPEKYQRLVAIAYGIRSSIELEFNRALLKVNNPQLVL